MKTRKNLCRRVGIEMATVEVRMENLKVEADIAVGKRGNPTVTNTLLNMAEVRSPVTCDVKGSMSNVRRHPTRRLLYCKEKLVSFEACLQRVQPE